MKYNDGDENLLFTVAVFIQLLISLRVSPVDVMSDVTRRLSVDSLMGILLGFPWKRSIFLVGKRRQPIILLLQ